MPQMDVCWALDPACPHTCGEMGRGEVAADLGAGPLQAPLCPDTHPKMASGGHTSPPAPTCTHGPSPPDWLFLFLALRGGSSPIIPTSSQMLGKLGEWRQGQGLGAPAYWFCQEGLGLSCLPPHQSAGVQGCWPTDLTVGWCLGWGHCWARLQFQNQTIRACEIGELSLLPRGGERRAQRGSPWGRSPGELKMEQLEPSPPHVLVGAPPSDSHPPAGLCPGTCQNPMSQPRGQLGGWGYRPPCGCEQAWRRGSMGGFQSLPTLEGPKGYLVSKHKAYHSELERAGLYLLQGRSRGQPASLAWALEPPEECTCPWVPTKQRPA